MDMRRRMVLEVENGMSLSQAARFTGVTRKTARKWVARARSTGLENIAELSRAPKNVPSRTEESKVAALVQMKEQYPFWGPRKLVVLLKQEQDIHVPLRTAERILQRQGLTQPSPEPVAPQHFERDSCGALLQMDFKGVPKSTPYSLLTVLDDHARYGLGFGPVPDKTGPSVQDFLWEIFGEHGLPDQMLMDNGDCWGAWHSWSPTAFEVWLMKLAVEPIHGSPRHPQTQGKVERFHKTAKLEIGDLLFHKDPRVCQRACQEFLQRYNWKRPHDALAGQVPGSRYAPFPRRRPDVLPQPVPEPGDIVRKVLQNGIICYKQNHYKVGRGLVGEHVFLREDVGGLRVFFSKFPLAYISELGPSRMFGEA